MARRGGGEEASACEGWNGSGVRSGGAAAGWRFRRRRRGGAPAGSFSQ